MIVCLSVIILASTAHAQFSRWAMGWGVWPYYPMHHAWMMYGPEWSPTPWYGYPLSYYPMSTYSAKNADDNYSYDSPYNKLQYFTLPRLNGVFPKFINNYDYSNQMYANPYRPMGELFSPEVHGHTYGPEISSYGGGGYGTGPRFYPYRVNTNVDEFGFRPRGLWNFPPVNFGFGYLPQTFNSVQPMYSASDISEHGDGSETERDESNAGNYDEDNYDGSAYNQYEKNSNERMDDHGDQRRMRRPIPLARAKKSVMRRKNKSAYTEKGKNDEEEGKRELSKKYALIHRYNEEVDTLGYDKNGYGYGKADWARSRSSPVLSWDKPESRY